QDLPLRRRPRRNRHVLAMKQERVLTLAEKRTVMVLVTAFLVDKKWTERDLIKRRQNGQPF
ncbi:hypothetical protein, partial [Tabrizicola thermarum]|uniref:hypothetical protein n=1 Tax=Tabrizicola thermarum TaxID=2670345 RepID=UPI001EE3D9EB